MYKYLKLDRPHRFWCLLEPLMMCSLYKVNVCTCMFSAIIMNFDCVLK